VAVAAVPDSPSTRRARISPYVRRRRQPPTTLVVESKRGCRLAANAVKAVWLALRCPVQHHWRLLSPGNLGGYSVISQIGIKPTNQP